MSGLIGLLAIVGIIFAVIVSSQPGSTFTLFGIEWKKSGLAGWVFWISVLIMLSGIFIFLIMIGIVAALVR